MEENRVAGYSPADWVEQLQGGFDIVGDQRMSLSVPEQLIPDGDLGPRDLVVGIEIDGRAKAYPLTTLQKQTPIADRLLSPSSSIFSTQTRSCSPTACGRSTPAPPMTNRSGPLDRNCALAMAACKTPGGVFPPG